jgi:hypothetical protein
LRQVSGCVIGRVLCRYARAMCGTGVQCLGKHVVTWHGVTPGRAGAINAVGPPHGDQPALDALHALGGDIDDGTLLHITAAIRFAHGDARGRELGC